METLKSWGESLGTQITEVASSVGSKLEKLADDLKLEEKLTYVGDQAEEKMNVVSGTYRKLVIQYLTSLVNGSAPAPELIHDKFTFDDGSEGGLRNKDYITSELNFHGRTSTGTFELFQDGQVFAFRMVQSFQFGDFRLPNGVDLSGKQVENVVTMGLVKCLEGHIIAHEQRSDDLSKRKFL